MTFRRPPPPQRREREPDEFASFEVERPRAVMATRIGESKPSKPVPAKIEKRVRQAIRDSARDEECLIRLPGCPCDRSMTIWSHNRHQRAGKGGAMKSFDLNGAYGCTHCDGIYDGQLPRPPGWTREMVELAWYSAHAESLVRLAQKGLV